MTPLDPLLQVVFEDSGLLVVNKPAGLVCHPTKGDAWSSLIGRVRLHLGQLEDVHLINRLDRETSGLVVVAKNAATAAALRRVWESRQVHKTYQAIVEGRPAWEHTLVEAPLGKDEASPVAIKDCVRPDGSAAQTEIWSERVFQRDGETFSVLRVQPRTGRKHQIRIHLQHLGHSIVGDKIYGPDPQLYLEFIVGGLTEARRRQLRLPHHALHAGCLEFVYLGQTVTFHAEPEPWFVEFCGGEPRID